MHCLQFLIYELVSGGNLRKPGGLFGNSSSEISANDLKQLETFFYKLSFFLHILDYTGYFSPSYALVYILTRKVLSCRTSIRVFVHLVKWVLLSCIGYLILFIKN